MSYIDVLNVREGDEPGGSTWSAPFLLFFILSFNSRNRRTGPVTEHRQEPIPQSSYHAQLDADEGEEEGEEVDVEMAEGKDDSVLDLTPSIRFWSDYSRVFYHPRGLHRVPDPAEWEREVGWIQGVERFNSYDAVRSFLMYYICSTRLD